MQENIIVDDCPDLFRYQFWLWFLMSFGIDVGSMLVSLSHRNQCFGMTILFYDLGDRNVIDFDQKWFPRIVPGAPLFRHFFDPVPQVVFLKVLWLTLIRFWLPFGSMLIVLDTLLDQF